MPRHTDFARGVVVGSGRGLYVAVILAMSVLVLSACGTAPQAAAAITGDAAPSPTATALPAQPTSLPGPAIVSSFDTTPSGFPTFAPQHPEQMATSTPRGTELPSEGASLETPAPDTPALDPDASADTGDAAPEATEVPPPTFTPPATPDDSSDDHYWLQRPVAAGGVVWTDKYYPYGSTRGGELRPHHGVEFNVPYSTEILAAAAGTVVVAGSDAVDIHGPHADFYGNLVILQHEFQVAGQPVFTLYSHLNEVLVSVGERIPAQTVLGLSGATGVADGPHMHFEVRVGENSYNNTRNPLLWLYPFPERGTIAGRVTWPDGSLVEGAPVTLNRVDGSSPYYGTTTYTGNSVNADGFWQENFAVDDVVVGYYEVVVGAGEDKFTAETWVYPYRTSLVEIVLD